MKRLVLLILLSIPALCALAQSQTDSTYTSKSGATFRVGQKITLGLGTDSGGWFRYVYVADAIFGTPKLDTHMSAENATKEFTITKIKVTHENPLSRKSPIQDVYLQITKGKNETKYLVSVEPALLAREISVDQNQASK